MHKDAAFVVRGELRRKVLLNLTKPDTPTSLAHKLNTDRASVSRSILELRDRGLLRCINPDDKRGRIYEITDEGKAVLKDIEGIGP